MNNNFYHSANQNSSAFTKPVKPFLGVRLLLLVSVIFLIIVLFVVGFFDQQEKAQTRADFAVLIAGLDKTGESPELIESYKSFLLGAETKTKPDQYQALFDLAQGVETQYSRNHNPKLREYVKTLREYVLANYHGLYVNPGAFEVVCGDQECGKLEYAPQISQIREEIEKADLGLNKPAMLEGLYRASLVFEGKTLAEKDNKSDNLYFVLSLLHAEGVRGNAQAKQIEAQLLAYMKENIPNFVEPNEGTPGATR